MRYVICSLLFPALLLAGYPSQAQDCAAEISFEYSVLNQSVFFDASLVGLSAEEVVTYDWDLGDGEDSILEDPVHTYPDAGSYHVCLTVFIEGGEQNCVLEICDQIIISGGLPCHVDTEIAPVNVENQNITASLNISCGNFSTVSGILWTIDGEEVSSEETSISIEVFEVGVHELCAYVEASSPGNQCSTMECQTFEVFPPTFELDPEIVVKDNGCSYRFIDATESEFEIVDRYWDFGDGTSSAASQPEKSYDTNGSYEVCLSLTAAWYGTEETRTTCTWVEASCDQEIQKPEGVNVEIVANSSTIQIKTVEAASGVEYLVHDMSGRQVASGTVSDMREIQVEHRGLYLVSIIDGQDVASTKVWVQ
ncbi:PKD domain-containing protein [Sanyastnella coralliicola]|uniref:PKD domain-containing protein n=1 Tax=Sanyastnella coralliicola TaxID=3069118 RepID=UPI0027BAB0B1|nr:PKD domain-containing protein [Longitalea sp. SCSIO 12813]